MVDFIYIGAPRAGSTWLAAALSEHPQIWIPPTKDVHFFNDRHILYFEEKYSKGVEYYKNIFAGAPSYAKLGELSPLYYFDPNTAYRIHKDFPDVKIIAFLRNPVDVIFSYYLLLQRIGRREKTLRQELKKTPLLADLGFYHKHLISFFDWFPQEQIYIQIYNTFFKNETYEIRKIYKFLEVDDNFKPSVIGKKINETSKPGSAISVWFIEFVINFLNHASVLGLKKLLCYLKFDRWYFQKLVNGPQDGNAPSVNSELGHELISLYEYDIRRLEKMLNISLDVWFKY